MSAADRVAALRGALEQAAVDGFVVPRADEHLSEYVPPSAERLAWLTGFTGSAGVAVVLRDNAAVFTDGRYVLQLAEQTDPSVWQRLHVTEDPPPAWIAAHAAKDARIGYDPLLLSEEGLRRYEAAGLAMTPLADNPLDAVWPHRPPPPAAPIVPQALDYAGRSSAEKREDVAQALRQAGERAAVLTDPASIAWLLNIRGDDVPFTPFALGFALAFDDARAELFMLPEKLTPAAREWLGNGVTVQPREALEPALRGLSGQRVRVDTAGSPVWFAQVLRQGGAEVVPGADPCLLPKACKNAVEQAGARAAHARDAVALCRFLYHLDQVGPTGQATEISAAARLLALRGEMPLFRGESFPAISGAGEHGAIIHYRVSEATDRPIRPDEVYLIDSGAQYADGTTDVTRTVWTGPGAPPAELRERATRVMQGHIAIATSVFPQGVAGPHLDALARRALWQIGLDFDHGTGHGVGSYLSVHEGPVSISRAAKPVAIAPGMILSTEPGFYLPGAYGIRLENLLLVQPATDLPNAGKPFLRFETLTLAPFDRRLLDVALLDVWERDWLDQYHARVLREVGPQLEPAALAWLERACAPLSSGEGSDQHARLPAGASSG